ncbi:Alpha/Beta hydrolase protein [Xylogone sp. PMI_703]|nr:Alpha/Beta hydrolase protein [Xylogone sp. PMI_703]
MAVLYRLLFTGILATLSSATTCPSAASTVTVTVTASPSSTIGPVVTVKSGSYYGIAQTSYNQDYFLGLPYAQPPVGDLRFRVPQSLNSTWTGIKRATEYSPFCVGYGGDDTNHALSEDCLYLSVTRPSTATPDSKLPVAVWMHGGGLFMGGSNDPRYNLSFIVENSVQMGMPMVGVSIQYRLSAFGFLGGKEVLAEGSTNLGYRDQRLALQWIQENIAAFGGDPAKVTIWGESGGAEAVGAQLLAYNGRDDGLYRAAILESGGPGVYWFPATFPGGFNSTYYQKTYDALVAKTSCTSSNTSSSLSCLRSLPFSELNAALNTSGAGPFTPQIDNDFIATFPSNQLAQGKFSKVPIIIGTNTDEETAFGAGYGVINTTEQFLAVLNSTLIPPNSCTAKIITYLYPDEQAVGIPSLSTYPEIIKPGSLVASTLGLQWRRQAAYFGDIVVIAPRRATSTAWSNYNISAYTYRFDVVVDGVPPYIGATHFQEVAFVFYNIKGQGNYNPNPFADKPATFVNLANQMSRSWVSFIATLDPNNHGIPGTTVWPVYNATSGGGAGMNFVFTVDGTHGGSYAENDTFRAEGIKFINENARDVYGL